MTTKREHTLTVGRYRVVGEYEAVPIDDDGTLGMPSTQLGRLELQAAIAVLSEAESILGEELRFVGKTMGLRQPDLAAAARRSAVPGVVSFSVQIVPVQEA